MLARSTPRHQLGQRSTSWRTSQTASREAASSQVVRKEYPLGLEVHHHMLDLGAVLDRVLGQVLAVPGLLEAAMWHLRGDRDVVVDPHAAEAEGLRHAVRPRHVTRPH